MHQIIVCDPLNKPPFFKHLCGIKIILITSAWKMYMIFIAVYKHKISTAIQAPTSALKLSRRGCGEKWKYTGLNCPKIKVHSAKPNLLQNYVWSSSALKMMPQKINEAQNIKPSSKWHDRWWHPPSTQSYLKRIIIKRVLSTKKNPHRQLYRQTVALSGRAHLDGMEASHGQSSGTPTKYKTLYLYASSSKNTNASPFHKNTNTSFQ